MIQIPKYDDAQKAVIDGTSGALDWFVVEHEPSAVHASAKFRSELQDALKEHEKLSGFVRQLDHISATVPDANQGARLKWSTRFMITLVIVSVITCGMIVATTLTDLMRISR